MENILHSTDVAAAIRDTLAGTISKAQLGKWAHLAMLADDEGTVPYDRAHRSEITYAIQRLIFMAEGPEYELDDVDLRATAQRLEQLPAGG